MPYAGIDNPEDVAKLDGCVEKIMAKGEHDKSSAVAICRNSMGLSTVNSLRWVEPFAYKSGEPFRVMPLGTYKRGTRTLTLTPERLKAMAANYDAGRPRWKIPIYFGHPTDATPDPPKVGNITKLDYRDGDGLFAVPEYTPDGEKAVADGAYQFVSPGVLWDLAGGEYVDEQGGKWNNIVDHVALTNKPYFGAQTQLFSAVALDEFYSEDQPRDESGKFGEGGGSSGGSSAGGDGGRGESIPSKMPGFKSARHEFDFVNKRLAAGGLKRGEKQALEARAEGLAKAIVGVTENASVGLIMDKFAMTSDMLDKMQDVMDAMSEEEVAAMKTKMAAMNGAELEAHIRKMIQSDSEEFAMNPFANQNNNPAGGNPGAGNPAPDSPMQKIMGMMKQVMAAMQGMMPQEQPQPQPPQLQAAPKAAGFSAANTTSTADVLANDESKSKEKQPMSDNKNEKPEGFTVTAEKFAALEAKAAQADKFAIELADVKKQADTFAADLAKAKHDRRYDQLKARADQFMAVPEKAETLAEKMLALEELNPELFTYFTGLLEKLDKAAVEAGLFSQIASERGGENAETMESVTDKVLKEQFGGDKRKYGEAMIVAAETRPELFGEYKLRPTAKK